MRALILAAGRGTRLGIDADIPKCLTVVGSKTLLDRYLDVLDAADIYVTIVVGHGASHIREHVKSRRVEPLLVMNDRYTEGSILSLAAGLTDIIPDQANAAFVEERDAYSGVLLLDGDVAFTPVLLQDLHDSAAENALLVDIGTVFTDEQYMAGINGQRVLALRRGPVPGHDTQGEWVGFAKLNTKAIDALHDAIGQQIARGETGGGYEDALASLLPLMRFAVVPTNELPWVEIDFADDLARARELFPET